MLSSWQLRRGRARQRAKDQKRTDRMLDDLLAEERAKHGPLMGMENMRVKTGWMKSMLEKVGWRTFGLEDLMVSSMLVKVGWKLFNPGAPC